MRIQHNIMAMNAYRNYTNNVSAMKKNLEKLSSGYKINRAGDDAAGLAISEKMRAQITGLETAQKNAKDGISLVQTAEGALTEVHDMLNRMVELATQSANGTYDNSTDRAQLQKELNQLTTEIDRIADSANFNGIQLLDGSMAVKSNNLTAITVSAIHDGTTTLTPEKVQFTINFKGFEATQSDRGDDASVDVTIAGENIGSVTVNGTLNGSDLAKEIFNLSGGSIVIDDVTYDITMAGDGMLRFTSQDYPTAVTSETAITVSFTGDNTVVGTSEDVDGTAGNNGQGVQVTFEKVGAPAAAGVLASASFALEGVKDGTALKIGDTTYIFAVGKDSKYKGSENVVDLTAYESSQADLDIIAAAMLSKAAESNTAVKVEANRADNVLVITEKEGGLDRSKWDVMGASSTDVQDATWKNFVQQGTISGNGLMLQIGDTAKSYNQLRVSIGDTHAAALGLDTIDISTQEGAAAAIDVIKAAINQVSDIRGTLGATQNRLDHTINNLSVMTENIQDAESTIRDVDVAEEMMAYTKNNILIQSAQAMLAQANQVPQGVLQLLQ